MVEFSLAFEACRGRFFFFFLVLKKIFQALGLHDESPNCIFSHCHSAMTSWAAFPCGSNSVTASPVMIAREKALRSPIVTAAMGKPCFFNTSRACFVSRPLGAQALRINAAGLLAALAIFTLVAVAAKSNTDGRQ